MQYIYNYKPETYHVCTVYSVRVRQCPKGRTFINFFI
jgi:hypothetical protein